MYIAVDGMPECSDAALRRDLGPGVWEKVDLGSGHHTIDYERSPLYELSLHLHFLKQLLFVHNFQVFLMHFEVHLDFLSSLQLLHLP